MANSNEYSKMINIYLQDQGLNPYPVNFYPGVKESEINLILLQTLDNFRHHAKNHNLKAWNRADAREVISNFYRSSSLVVSEAQPKAREGTFTTANPSPFMSPEHSQDLSCEFPIKAQDLKKAKKSLPIDIKKNTCGPAAEKVMRSPRDIQSAIASRKNKKYRIKSVAKVCLSNYKTTPQPIQVTQVMNEMSFFPGTGSSKNLASQERGDTSLTFNPLKGNALFERPKSSPEAANQRQFRFSSRHGLLNDSQSINEVSPFQESDLRKSLRRPQLQILPEALKIRIEKSPLYQTGDIAIYSIDGNNNDIYSFIQGLGPFSYLIETIENKFNQKMPPPVYMNYESLSSKKSLNKNDILKGLEITLAGELKLIELEILKNQKGIIMEILQSLVKSIAEGRGVVGVSLPVRIFEPRSLLERVCDWWTFMPNYIIPAVKLQNPVERMKQVIAMAIGGLYVSAKQLKPFNPLLGETFQAIFPEHNININLEHTSHHPPIANFYVTHKDFKFWGRYEFCAKLEGMTKNTVHMQQQGPNHIDFSDGQRIKFYWPCLQIDGVAYGERTCKYIDHMKFIDEKNRIKAIIKFGESGEHKTFSKKRTDAFYGKIYRYKRNTQASPNSKKKYNELNFEDVLDNISTLYGSWLEYLRIDDKEVWNIDEDRPTQYIPIEHPLPSDSRFREDLIWVQRNNKRYAQEWKLKLEERQRYEKKLRQDYAKKQQKK